MRPWYASEITGSRKRDRGQSWRRSDVYQQVEVAKFSFVRPHETESLPRRIPAPSNYENDGPFFIGFDLALNPEERHANAHPHARASLPGIRSVGTV